MRMRVRRIDAGQNFGDHPFHNPFLLRQTRSPQSCDMEHSVSWDLQGCTRDNRGLRFAPLQLLTPPLAMAKAQSRKLVATANHVRPSRPYVMRDTDFELTNRNKKQCEDRTLPRK